MCSGIHCSEGYVCKYDKLLIDTALNIYILLKILKDEFGEEGELSAFS